MFPRRGAARSVGRSVGWWSPRRVEARETGALKEEEEEEKNIEGKEEKSARERTESLDRGRDDEPEQKRGIRKKKKEK